VGAGKKRKKGKKKGVSDPPAKNRFSEKKKKKKKGTRHKNVCPLLPSAGKKKKGSGHKKRAGPSLVMKGSEIAKKGRHKKRWGFSFRLGKSQGFGGRKEKEKRGDVFLGPQGGKTRHFCVGGKKREVASGCWGKSTLPPAIAREENKNVVFPFRA